MQVRYAAKGGDGAGPLFRGAILESGAAGSLALRGRTPEEGDAYTEGTLGAVGCAVGIRGGEALGCLRGVGAEELVRVWYEEGGGALREELDEWVQTPVGFAVDGVWVGSRDYWGEEVAGVPMVGVFRDLLEAGVSADDRLDRWDHVE